MFNGWPRKAMVGVSVVGGAAYVGALMLDCWAKEPGDFEPAPVGAVLLPATTVAVSNGLIHFAEYDR